LIPLFPCQRFERWQWDCGIEGNQPKERNMSKKHYHAMAGLHGCMPNYSSTHDCYALAVDDLADVHELGKRRTKELYEQGYLELNLHRDGNEYCEIVECDEAGCEDDMVNTALA
jgi:hypothetical protein